MVWGCRTSFRKNLFDSFLLLYFILCVVVLLVASGFTGREIHEFHPFEFFFIVLFSIQGFVHNHFLQCFRMIGYGNQFILTSLIVFVYPRFYHFHSPNLFFNNLFGPSIYSTELHYISISKFD